jgi:hypothetical protein
MSMRINDNKTILKVLQIFEEIITFCWIIFDKLEFFESFEQSETQRRE